MAHPALALQNIRGESKHCFVKLNAILLELLRSHTNNKYCLRGRWRERRWGVCEDEGGSEGGESVKVKEGVKAMEGVRVERE